MNSCRLRHSRDGRVRDLMTWGELLCRYHALRGSAGAVTGQEIYLISLSYRINTFYRSPAHTLNLYCLS